MQIGLAVRCILAQNGGSVGIESILDKASKQGAGGFAALSFMTIG